MMPAPPRAAKTLISLSILAFFLCIGLWSAVQAVVTNG